MRVRAGVVGMERMKARTRRASHKGGSRDQEEVLVGRRKLGLRPAYRDTEEVDVGGGRIATNSQLNPNLKLPLKRKHPRGSFSKACTIYFRVGAIRFVLGPCCRTLYFGSETTVGQMLYTRRAGDWAFEGERAKASGRWMIWTQGFCGLY